MSVDQTTPNVGSLLTGTEGRDAIHFALAPVTAKTVLIPGQEVDADGGTEGKLVGIVDPFLKTKGIVVVRPGERFYLFLYPNTITSLRHVWTHPDFVIKVPGANK